MGCSVPLDELRSALDAQTSSEAATALVYYSGHGVAEAGSNWLGSSQGLFVELL